MALQLSESIREHSMEGLFNTGRFVWLGPGGDLSLVCLLVFFVELTLDGSKRVLRDAI